MSEIERGTLTNGEKKDRLELYKAALSNDWKKAESIYNKPGMKYGIVITSRGETALHVAALAGHTNFVQNLVNKMNEDEIRIETVRGNTAFHCAATSGNVEIAEAILMKHNKLSDLAMAKGIEGCLPIVIAAWNGNTKMVRYLYNATKLHLQDPIGYRDEDRISLLLGLIHSEIYDVAIQLAKALVDHGIDPESMAYRSLRSLVVKPLTPPTLRDRFLGLFCRHVRDKNLMYKNTVQLVRLLWDQMPEYDQMAPIIHNLVLEAAKEGNIEFLSILIASSPDVVFTYDKDSNYTIFHHAIMNRHVDIFKFIYIGSVKSYVTNFIDFNNKNMLHLAGELPPPSRLNIVPGAALQLQRELLWFQEVEKVMLTESGNQKNNMQQVRSTPHEVFVKEHKGLMEEGEKWMRETANSCMIVTALITTIAFAAAITVPGGNGDDGYPHFESETLFKAFAIADSISLISSTTSLLGFLSILTARYRMDDFRWSLPNKLFLGLLTLFVSIVAMMVAFVLSIFIIFKSTPPVLTATVVGVSSLPVVLFIWHHLGLFYDVFRSTYMSRLLFKSRVDPNSLFK